MVEEIRQELINMFDEKNAELTVKLCPNYNIEEVLGIKIPELRKIAKRIVKNNEFEQYIKECNKAKYKKYLEEIILEGLVISYSKIELKDKLVYLKKFIPKINSWLINDTVCATLKVKRQKDQEMLWNFIIPYLKSQKQFDVRFAVVIMLDNFIIDEYVDEVISKLNSIENKEYYTQMAVAWTLAEIGIKFNDKAMKFLKGKNNLDDFTYNKTLQKMRESYRISHKLKEELKTMKRT